MHIKYFISISKSSLRPLSTVSPTLCLFSPMSICRPRVRACVRACVRVCVCVCVCVRSDQPVSINYIIMCLHPINSFGKEQRTRTITERYNAPQL